MRKIIVTAIMLSVGVVAALGAEQLSLKQSVDLALKNNPAVLASKKKVDAADARLWQAVGTFLPSVKLNGNYSKTYTQPSVVQLSAGSLTQTVTFGVDAAGTVKSWQAQLNQAVFVPALFPALKIAQRSDDSARADFRKTILDTSFSATQAYFQVIAAERLVKLAQDTLALAQSHLDQVNNMVRAGVSTQSDKLRSEVQVANAEVDLTKAKNMLATAKDIFNNNLGRDLETEILLNEEGFNGTVAKLPEYQNLLQLAFSHRPDWQMYLDSYAIGEENIRLAQSALLPAVVLNGQTGNQLTEYPSIYQTSVNSWTITGAASWTLFDGLSRENKIKEASANLDSQRATEEQIRNNIALEVHDAYLNLTSVLESLGSAKKAVTSAEENYKVTNLRYNSGAGTNIDMIDAQVALAQAKYNYIKAIFDVEVGKAKINKVTGVEVM